MHLLAIHFLANLGLRLLAARRGDAKEPSVAYRDWEETDHAPPSRFAEFEIAAVQDEGTGDKPAPDKAQPKPIAPSPSSVPKISSPTADGPESSEGKLEATLLELSPEQLKRVCMALGNPAAGSLRYTDYKSLPVLSGQMLIIDDKFQEQLTAEAAEAKAFWLLIKTR